MYSVSGPSIGEIYHRLLMMLLLAPTVPIGRVGKNTKEILGMRLNIYDVRNNILVHPIRTQNYRFMLAEWLWIIAGRADVETVTRYNSQIRKFSDDGQTFAGAYGPRLLFQWNYVIENLRKDPSSRQAVATIWTPNPGPSRDIPCTISCQFLIRGTKLHGIFTMRSSDAWLGVPYDVFNFCQIINMLAGELDVLPGGLILNMGSSHLYENNWEDAKKVIEYGPGYTVASPALSRFLNPPQAEAILDGAPLGEFFRATIRDEWKLYINALHSKTSAECLAILEGK